MPEVPQMFMFQALVAFQSYAKCTSTLNWSTHPLPYFCTNKFRSGDNILTTCCRRISKTLYFMIFC